MPHVKQTACQQDSGAESGSDYEDAACSISSHSTSIASRNPQGRRAHSNRSSLLQSSVLLALAFMCPMRDPVHCVGVYMSQQHQNANPQLALDWAQAILHIRREFHVNLNPKGNKRSGNKRAVVTRFLWQFTTGDTPICPTNKTSPMKVP